MESRRNRGAASDGRLRHPADLLFSRSFIHHRFSGGAVAHRHPDFYKAHATAAGGRQLRVIAIVRDFNPVRVRGIDEVLLGGNLIVFAVNVDGYEI